MQESLLTPSPRCKDASQDLHKYARKFPDTITSMQGSLRTPSPACTNASGDLHQYAGKPPDNFHQPGGKLPNTLTVTNMPGSLRGQALGLPDKLQDRH